MVRPLSKELQKRAIEELHEDPARVEEDIKHIQEWIKQQPHLNAPTDKQWILLFLRGCKFSLEITKQKFDMYYTSQTRLPELFKLGNIFSTENQTILNSGYILCLPYSKNYVGPRVMLLRYQNFDTNTMTIENTTPLFYMILNILMNEDDNLIVSGIILWLDMVNFPLNLLLQFTPTYVKNMFECFQKALPLRFKGFLLTGSFAAAQTLFNVMKAYMAPKLRDRFFIYNKDKFEDLFEKIPRDHLPREYGGENSDVENIKDYWIKKVESYSAWFEESKKYGTNEAKRQGKSTLLDDVVGIDGSFRKLDID